MYDYLDAKRFPETDNCDVKLETIEDDDATATTSDSDARSIPYYWKSSIWFWSTGNMVSRIMLLASTTAVLLASVIVSHAY